MDGGAVLSNGLAVHGEAVRMDASGAEQFSKYGGHTTRAMEGFTEPVASGHAVDQERHIVTVGLPILNIVRDTHVLRDGHDMHWAVRAAADRGIYHDGVLDGFTR